MWMSSLLTNIWVGVHSYKSCHTKYVVLDTDIKSGTKPFVFKRLQIKFDLIL